MDRRRLERTEAGKVALGYAEGTFSLESELEEMIRLHPLCRPRDLRSLSRQLPQVSQRHADAAAGGRFLRA